MTDSGNKDKESVPPLTGEFMSVPYWAEVGIFMPPAEDSSNVFLNHLCKRLFQETDSINLRIFRTRPKSDPRVKESPELSEKSFIHTGLLRDIVFPFQKDIEISENATTLLSPQKLAEKYPHRLVIEDVADVNDPGFIRDSIEGNKALKMAFSVRNLQIFHDGIIDAFAKKGDARLINSHPAALPDIRGLEGPFWTRFLNLKEHTTSLHAVVRDIDAGDILDYTSSPVDYTGKKSVMQYPREIAPTVADMVFKQIHLCLIRKGVHSGLKIQEGNVGYYTLPTQSDLKEAKERGIILTNAQEQINWLAKSYTDKSHRPALVDKLTTAYQEFLIRDQQPAIPIKENSNDNRPEPDDIFLNRDLG